MLAESIEMAVDSNAVFILSILSGSLVVLGTIFLTKRFFKRSPSKTLTGKDEKIPLKLIEKRALTHDTRIFRFALPSASHILGLPTGQHVFLSATINGSLIVRPYTPISTEDDVGFMELLIKIYFKDVHPKFPDGGKMTQHLERLQIGDTIDVRGPNGLMVYEGKGIFKIRPKKTQPYKEFKYKKLCMIAGGSGITPMYQMIRHVLGDTSDMTDMWLVFANQTEDDILLREELDTMSKNNPDRFHVWYTIDRPAPGWKYGAGFVSAEMLAVHLCPPADDVLVTMCGPPPMIQFACLPALDKLGFSGEQRFTF